MTEGGGKDLYKIFFVLVVLVFIGSIAFFIALRYSQNKIGSTTSIFENANLNSDKKALAVNTNQDLNNNNTNSESKVESLVFYNEGVTLFNNKKYTEAIEKISQAVDLYQKDPQYYSKQSQAEKNLGQTETAINTVRKGLENNPDSDLLKTRLDILQKQWLGSQQQ